MYVEISVLCTILHILKGSIQGVERGMKDESRLFNAFVVIFVFIYLKSMQRVTITVKKSTGGFQFDYATYWILTIKVVT